MFSELQDIWQWDIQDIKNHLKKQQKDWKEYEACYPKFHGFGGKLSLLRELLASFLKWRHVIITVI